MKLIQENIMVNNQFYFLEIKINLINILNLHKDILLNNEILNNLV
jgi:hypothetical protein